MKRYVCQRCGKEFTSPQALAGHVKAAHSGASKTDRMLALLSNIDNKLGRIESLLEEILGFLRDRAFQELKISEKVELKLPSEEGLPEYAVNNPWINVLARRGRD